MAWFFCDEAHIVAQGLRLGEAGQPERRLAGQAGEVGDVQLAATSRQEIDAGLVPAAQLEDQGLVLQQAAVPGWGSAADLRRRLRAGWGGRW